jgi:hypothetical protein
MFRYNLGTVSIAYELGTDNLTMPKNGTGFSSKKHTTGILSLIDENDLRCCSKKSEA